jgi:hypothetical protein
VLEPVHSVQSLQKIVKNTLLRILHAKLKEVNCSLPSGKIFKAMTRIDALYNSVTFKASDRFVMQLLLDLVTLFKRGILPCVSTIVQT